jgi:hypothetical protein
MPSSGIESRRQHAEGNAAFAPETSMLLIAFLAMLTVQVFRVANSRWLPILWAEAALFTLLPLALFCVMRFRFDSVGKLTSTKAVIGFQFGAILTGILVVVWHASIRPFGLGDANEVVALVVLQSVGWYLAVFSKVPGFEKTSIVICGALVFFVCCMADRFEIFLLGGLFAFVGLWWLLGRYWDRLDSKSIDGDARVLRLHGSAISLTTIVIGGVMLIAASVPFVHNGFSIAGFMPFSGGEKGYQDEFAMSGIGDGNMLTAGNNATTTGAVDSNEFIEDHKPSLYDVMSERYDGPVVKIPRNRAVSLSVIAKHLDEAKQSEQAGRSFRTMRNSDKTTDIELEDRITKALFFVEGSVPARFAINTFQKFDGWDWSLVSSQEQDLSLPSITLQKSNGVPFFRIAQQTADYLTSRRSHCVKVMRLDSTTIPVPAFLHQWHIAHVDKTDMFGWNEAGLIRMSGDAIPTHTVIDLQSFVPNFHLLRSISKDAFESSQQRNRQLESDSVFLQVPNNQAKSSIESLATDWSAGIEPGWKQVESIVNHFRSDFELNPSWETDSQAEDTVSRFLEQGSGPSYMFATTCAMALRSVGYETRVASGFLVQKTDYDSRTRQSIVTSQNLHMWPEVCLDGRVWIPVEPTPGYPVPYSTQTAWQWLASKAFMVCHWVMRRPLLTLAATSIVFFAFVFRAELVLSLMYCWWFIVRIFWPSALLKTTRQLIDLRFQLAGDQRPTSETIKDWYSRVEPNLITKFLDLWNARNFSDNPQAVSTEDLVVTCQASVDSLTLKSIREFLSVEQRMDKQ